MSKYRWIKDEFPNDLDVKQVYGVVFSNDGKILLRIEDGKYKLTGGKPELNEKFEDTLKREYQEELNIEIENIYYLGYQFVDEENDKKSYAQVRMIAQIKKVGNINPDTDNGKIYKRFLANFNNVKKYLNYNDIAGNQLIDDAITKAKKKYQFNINEKEDFI